MNAVKEWSAVICMAALIAAMLQNLVPSGSMQRMVKFVIGVFIICVLIVPLKKITPIIQLDIDEDTNSINNSQLKNTVDNQYSLAVKESITNLVMTELNSINIKCKNVNVIMDTNEDKCISINKVVVNLAKGYDSECKKAENHLEKVLGLKTEVTSDGS
jgi:stage III sporulation protein AF